MKTRRPLRGWSLPAILIAGAATGSAVATPQLSASQTALVPGENPDFDGAAYLPLQCFPPGDSRNDGSPASTDLVGDGTNPVAFFAHDSVYLYFRYRVDGDPSGPKGFAPYAWVALMQVGSGNEFQHQYELSLNGVGADDEFGNIGPAQGDTIEIWKNDPAHDIDFSPLFNDPSELRLYSQRYDFSSGATVNTTPLARISLTGDGAFTGAGPSYFVEFAFPLQVLIAKGVITNASDIERSLFFVATSKDHLDCPFLPASRLSIDKRDDPSTLPVDVSTHLVTTIAVGNEGPGLARGIVIHDPARPAYVTNVAVIVSSDDPTVTWTVVTTSPLKIKVPRLPVGKSVTARISAEATPSCRDGGFMTTAGAFASNAAEVNDSALVRASLDTAEVCDGADNDCDGSVDEGGGGLCSDHNACNGVEVCTGRGGCGAGTAPNCSDGNACTMDACDAEAGCTHRNTTGPCDDGSACTMADTCLRGRCLGGPPPNCDDGNFCTDDSCVPASGCAHRNNSSPCDDRNICTAQDHCREGVCEGGPHPSCDDGNVCTTDFCDPHLMPLSQASYRSLCAGSHPNNEITQADVECVNDSSTFSWIGTTRQVCGVLERADEDDECERAQAQFMAALLNRCRYLVFDTQTIASKCSAHGTIGAAIVHTDLILSASPTREECSHARCESEEIDTTPPTSGCKSVPTSVPCHDGRRPRDE